MGLTTSQGRSRRGFDYRVVRELRSPILRSILAFASEDDLRRGREVTVEEGEQGRANVYVVTYDLEFLTGPGAVGRGAVVVFALPGDTYPFVAPAAGIRSAPTPWSPHVHASGMICIGEGWAEARGNMLLAQLIVHVARLLNCDEPDRGPEYGGWNPAAIAYWRTTMGCQPLRRLDYPVLPIHVTHGVQDPAAAFRAVAADADFRALVLGDAVFAPRSEP